MQNFVSHVSERHVFEYLDIPGSSFCVQNCVSFHQKKRSNLGRNMTYLEGLVGFSGSPKDMGPLGPHTIPIPLP